MSAMKWLWMLLACGCAAQEFDVALVGNAFHPREIIGINTHWDASTIQLSSGSAVSNWVDTVGGISASNTVVSMCPTLIYTNGVKALRFDGVDDYLNAGTNTLNLLTNSWSMFCVGSMESSANQSFFGKSKAAQSPARYAFAREAQIEIIYELAEPNGFSAATFTPSLAFASGVYWNIGAGYGFRTNGVIAATKASTGFNGLTNYVSNFRFLIGAYNNATDTGNILPLNGTFCEFIAVKRNGSNWVSSIESRKINEYFQNKYKLQNISRL